MLSRSRKACHGWLHQTWPHQTKPQCDLPVVLICRSISACAVGQIISTSLAVSRPIKEGRIAIVTDVGRGMRWTLRAANDERWLDA